MIFASKKTEKRRYLVIFSRFLREFRKKKNRTGRTDTVDTPFRLLLSGSTNGAGISTSAAFDALIGIDLELAVTFGNGFYGAFTCASAASDAFIGNFVCHSIHLHGNSQLEQLCLSYHEMPQVASTGLRVLTAGRKVWYALHASVSVTKAFSGWFLFDFQ